MKSNFWLRIGKNVFEETVGKVKDGTAVVKDKKFIIDENEGFDIVKSKFFGLKKEKIKYYLVDWKTLKPLKIKDDEIVHDKVSPKLLKRLVENELLYGLFRRKSKIVEESDVAKFLFLGAIAGGFIVYILFVLHLIPIP